MDTNGNLRTLLLKDLCSRLPYKVECEAILNNGGNYPCVLDIGTLNWHINGDHVLKPYLRPMSSMTDEERKEVETLIKDNRPNPYGEINNKGMDNLLLSVSVTSNVLIDYLNAHHFDYRSLIKKGLALEASEEMYNIK